jgi:hypothetical protein
MEKLGILVERVAETNRELVDRIATSAGRVVPPPPSPQQQRRHTTTTTTATTTNTKRRSAISEINITPWVKFSFEAILQKTKAYRSSKRTSFLPSEDSTATPTPPTTSTPWSQLSSLNLAQVSNLAVVELPLWPEDIVGDSIRHYDFRAELPIILLPDDSAPPTPTAGAAPRKSPPPLSLRLLPTPPHTPRTPTNCDSPLPPLPTDDFTPPHSPSYTPSTHQAITKTLAVYTTLLELVPSPPPTWETGTNFRHHVSQFSTEMLRDFAVDVHDEVLWRRRGLGGGEKGGRLKGISDTQLEHLSADVVWEVRRRFAPMGLGGVQLEGNAF